MADYESAGSVKDHVKAYESLKSLEEWIEDEGLLGRSVGASAYGELFSAVRQHARDARTASMTDEQRWEAKDFRGQCKVSAHRALRLGPDFWEGDLTTSVEDSSVEVELPDEPPEDAGAYLDGLREFPSTTSTIAKKRHEAWAEDLERDYALMRTIADEAAKRMASSKEAGASDGAPGGTVELQKRRISLWRELAERADRSARVASKMHRAFSVSDVYEAFRKHVIDCIDAKKAELMGIEGRYDEWIPKVPSK